MSAIIKLMIAGKLSRILVSLSILISLLSPLLFVSRAQAIDKFTMTASSPSLGEGTSQIYEIRLTEPIICPDLGGNPCEVTLNFTSSDPTRISFSVPSVSFLVNEWSQPRFVTVSTVRDYISTPNLVQNLKVKALSDSEFYKNWVLNKPLTINNLDDSIIDGSSEFTGTRDEEIAINDLQVTGDSNSNVSLNLYVPSGNLLITEVAGLTLNSSTQDSNLNFSGSRANVNAALLSLKFIPNETSDVLLQVTIDGLPNSIYNHLNRHIYQSGDSGSWPTWYEASASAQNQSFQGTSGYLATITNLDEQTAIDKLKIGGWLGASDATNEGEWKWAGGPENDIQFWNGGVNGSVVNNSFTNWADGMPDDYNGSNSDGEDCLQYYRHVSMWNDQNCLAQQSPEFIIEYGTDNQPITLNYKNINIHVTPGRDLNNDSTEDANQDNVVNIKDLNGKWVAIETSYFNQCTLSNVSVTAESNLSIQNELYDYPGGMIDFSGSCMSPQSSTQLRIFYYDTSLEDVIYHKYNPNDQTYTQLTDTTFEETIINDKNVVIATYFISDGSAFDTDGDDSNGQWTDPIGLASLYVPPSQNSVTDSGPKTDTLALTGQTFRLVKIALTALTLILILSISYRQKRKS